MAHPSRFALFFLILAATACREEGTILVRDLTFQGVKSVEEGRLRSVLATKKSARVPWGRKRFFSRPQFDTDLERIKAFYADRGYPRVRVTAVDVKLNDAQNEVRIAVTIDEGEPVRVGGVELRGFDVLPPERIEPLRQRLPLKAGDPLDRQLVVASRDAAVSELQEAGYAYAKVDFDQRLTAALSDPTAAPQQQHVSLTLIATPGPLASVGSIEVTGNKSVGDNVIRRQLLFKPGDRFRRSQLQASQRKLYGMELFEFATIEVADQDQPRTDVPLRVTVAEGKHRKINLGVGYGTEEKARVDGQWQHVNFLGGARTAGIHARWSSLDRGARISFHEPYLLTPHFSFNAEAQSWFVSEPAYASDTYGGRATVTHRGSGRTIWSATFVNELQQTTISDAALADLSLRPQLIALGLDPRTGFQDGTLVSLAIGMHRNTTSNLLNATQGSLLSLQAERAGGLLPGTYNYVSLSGEGRHYMAVGRVVLANRLQYGSVDPASNLDANVPFSRRLFLGGSTSLRGWGRFEVSPLSGSGLPIGGYTLLEGTSEARVPVRGNLSGVIFLDAGNVWAPSWKVHPGDLRYDGGLGLRYATPIGPLRVDLGYQLNPLPNLLVDGKPQTRPFRVHFSIGQAF